MRKSYFIKDIMKNFSILFVIFMSFTSTMIPMTNDGQLTFNLRYWNDIAGKYPDGYHQLPAHEIIETLNTPSINEKLHGQAIILTYKTNAIIHWTENNAIKTLEPKQLCVRTKNFPGDNPCIIHFGLQDPRKEFPLTPLQQSINNPSFIHAEHNTSEIIEEPIIRPYTITMSPKYFDNCFNPGMTSLGEDKKTRQYQYPNKRLIFVKQ
jgi:hypothetical protein